MWTQECSEPWQKGNSWDVLIAVWEQLAHSETAPGVTRLRPKLNMEGFSMFESFSAPCS